MTSNINIVKNSDNLKQEQLKYYTDIFNTYMLPNYRDITYKFFRDYFDSEMIIIKQSIFPFFNFNIQAILNHNFENINYFYSLKINVPHIQYLKEKRIINEGKLKNRIYSKIYSDINDTAQTLSISRNYACKNGVIYSRPKYYVNDPDKSVNINDLDKMIETLIELKEFIKSIKNNLLQKLCNVWKEDLVTYLEVKS